MVGCDKVILFDRFVIYIYSVAYVVAAGIGAFFFNWMWNSAEEDHEIPIEHIELLRDGPDGF